MERLGLTLQGAIDRFGYKAAFEYAGHVASDAGSYTWRSINPKLSEFCSSFKTNVILADIFDAINAFAYMYAKSHVPKGTIVPPPETYPRPWKSDGRQRFGRGAIPISKFDEWYYGGDE